MKAFHPDVNRDALCRTTYQCGGFVYDMDADFQKLPDSLAGTAIAGGCCDKEGNIFLFSRNLDHPIIKLDPDGRYVTDFGAGLFKATHFLTVTPQDTLLCSDTAAHVVRELTLDGKLIRDFGTYGVPSDSGFTSGGWERARRAGDIYPSEYGIIGQWAFYDAMKTIQRAAPPFNRPTDSAVNSKGEYYFSDGYGNAAIHKFSPEGKLLKTWGGPGREAGRFLCPHSIEVDSADQVWVGDREGNSVHVFDEDGNILAYISGYMGQPSGIQSDGKYIYVIGRGGYLTIFNTDIDIVAQLGFFNSDLRAHDICCNANGDLFLFPTYANIDHQVIKLTRRR